MTTKRYECHGCDKPCKLTLENIENSSSYNSLATRMICVLGNGFGDAEWVEMGDTDNECINDDFDI